jgi:hypothetical protein
VLGIVSCGILNDQQVDYNADVKPILNKNCISCHGGVKKQGGFSLLFRDEALSVGESGRPGIVPGDASSSEMYRRITSTDPEERMPHDKDPLSKEDIGIIKKWINQGAEFSTHWAYKKIEKVTSPTIDPKWGKNYIDGHIIGNINIVGLQPSQEADAITLSRRAALDIIGMPIDNEEKKAFIANPSDATYEAYINSLLALPQYGEKWTSMWLDMARYADTKGFERDGNRTIWKYRDWLIDAYNKDLSYDQFITQQLAGDLMPEPDEAMYVATAFHRNTMTNDEGGTDNEEYRVAANIDRVNTTWETLMGTTFACVQCHSHPYDPFTHEEYYKFMSFFNNSRDEDTYDDYPVYRHYGGTDSLLLMKTKTWLSKNVTPQEKKDIELFLTTLQPSYNSITMTEFNNSELNDTKFLALRQPSSAVLPKVNLTGKKSIIIRLVKIFGGGNLEIYADNNKGQKLATFLPGAKQPDKWWEVYEIPITSPIDGIHDVYFSYNNPTITDINDKGLLFDWLHFKCELPGKSKLGYDEFRKDFITLVSTKPSSTTPIFVDNPQDMFRKNQVFERGSFLTRTKEVTPGIPEIFKPKQKMQNRLDLAKWMTSYENPLVSRTMVNRMWEQLFGTGLVETLEDLGSQGAKPMNQKLLDDISYRFMHEYKWSMKSLLKTMVMSATYRQSSLATEVALEKDQFNTYLARGPRVRLTGEQIRDQALVIADAYNPKMYGPPVKPYQPEGIWNSPYNGQTWVMDTLDNNQYRRALYTFWKRTSAYPGLTTFDGVGREVCISRRIRTNTPLQAFVTLNDSSFVDMAYLFAKNISKENKDASKAIAKAYHKATGKNISPSKLTILIKLYNETKIKYDKNTAMAKELCKTDDTSLAAMVVICNTILNLDEVISKS